MRVDTENIRNETLMDLFRWKVITVILLLNSLFTSAQKDSLIHGLTGFQAHYGFIIQHSPAVKDAAANNPYGFELDFLKINTSFKSWSVFSSFWFSGLQFGYFNFQNPDVLGSAFLLTAFAEPVIVSRNRFLLTMRAGGGITYITEIYDEIENPQNKFFCTSVSFPVYLALRFKYQVKPQLNITLSGYYNHISNGGIKQPNYGMNFPTVALGIERFRDPFILERNSYRIDDPKSYKSWYLRTQALLSYKVAGKTEVYPYKGALVSGINLGVFRRFGVHYALGAGAEYFNDRALKESISREDLNVDHKSFALLAGQDFHFGKVIFSQHFGFYLYSPYKPEDPVYQLYGIGARLHPRIMTGVFLKAHRHRADFMGITISYLAGTIK